LEKLSNPLQNSLRYIIIDNFSSAWVPISDFMEYDLWLSEISKIFKLLNNKFYIGVLVFPRKHSNFIRNSFYLGNFFRENRKKRVFWFQKKTDFASSLAILSKYFAFSGEIKDYEPRKKSNDYNYEI